MRKFVLTCIVEEYVTSDELSAEFQQLIHSATAALESAYAPYSGFKVAASILLEDGTIVCGSNQENAAYPSGLCAERVAFFSAASLYPHKKIKTVAITTSFSLQDPIAPCGACRQVMAEYELKQNAPIKIILAHPGKKVYVLENIKGLLPLYFSGEWLKK